MHVLRGNSSQLKTTKASSSIKGVGCEAQIHIMELVNSKVEMLGTYCHYIQATQGTELHPTLSTLVQQ